MSQFGVFMLMAALTLGMVGLIKFLAWLTELQEQGGIGAAIHRKWDRYVDDQRYNPDTSRALNSAGSVNTFAYAAPVVAPSPENRPLPDARPSLETRPSDGPDKTEDPIKRRKKMLDTYTSLRAHGYSRDEARALLGAWNIPLDNNVWAQAAPPPAPEPEYTTPIAGRVTAAQFETDPELAYQQPPQ